MARGMQSCSLSGASTPTPLAPEVCATMVPGRTTEVAANPETRAASSVSGTASSRSSALPATSGTGDTGVSGNQRSARCRDARETALHATTTWSTRSSATPKAVPTRPAEMIPTLSRAGRNPSNCTIADDPHKSLGSFQSRVAGTGRSLRLYRGNDVNGLWRSPQSSRRRRRPPPDGLVCSRASNSATDWPPDGVASASNGSVVRCRAEGEGGGDITGSRSGDDGDEGGIGGGGGDIAGAGGAGSPGPGGGKTAECRALARRPGSRSATDSLICPACSPAVEWRPRRSAGVGSLTACEPRDGALSYCHGPAPALSPNSEIQWLPGGPGGSHCPSELTGCQLRGIS